METVNDDKCINGIVFNLVTHQEITHDGQVDQKQN
jgi:hypothetical protein